MAYVDLRRRREDHSRRRPEASGHRAANDPLLLLTGGFVAGSLASSLLSNFLGYPDPAFFLLFAASSLLVVLLCAVRRRSRQDGWAKTPGAGSEKQLLMAIQDTGDGLTPVEAALETSLTVDEAEELLTRLAGRGHLVVRSREGALLYALPGGQPSGTP